ncbi:MAG TPA: galactokinase family protein [Anaerolineales bacterium]|nr:galactokinase family protein [Anaerolineales bacterium]
MAEELSKLTAQYPDVKRFEKGIGGLVAENFFQKGIDIFINRTPGRLDLMGGNDDYTGGLVFETTIREATLVAIQPRTDQKVIFYNPAVKALGWKDKIEFALADLVENGQVKPLEQVRDWINRDPEGAWCAYLLGDLYFLIKQYPEKVKQGFALYLESDVPLGKGVSSSAALEVAPMKAMAKMYGVEVEGIELASWTQWVEIALTQSACGIMDQFAVVMGDEGYFVPMLCQPCQPLPLVKLPEHLRFWGIDTGVRHAVAGIEYESARAATFMGYRFLCDWEKLEPKLDESGALPRWVEPKWNGYLANVSPSEFRSKYEQRLPEVMAGADFNKEHRVHLDPFTPVRPEVDYPVRGATRYAVEENWRVHNFFSLTSKPFTTINEITTQLLGELMYQSHIGYSQCGLGSEATDQIVELVRSEKSNGLLGAKITGGGAGGTVAVLGLNNPNAERAFRRVVEKYHSLSGKEPFLFEGSSAGCDKFGVLQVCY